MPDMLCLLFVVVLRFVVLWRVVSCVCCVALCCVVFRCVALRCAAVCCVAVLNSFGGCFGAGVGFGAPLVPLGWLLVALASWGVLAVCEILMHLGLLTFQIWYRWGVYKGLLCKAITYA